jgi:U3 small nucleolar RNA-associated protein 9
MVGSLGKVDATGSFLASLVTRPGKSEVLIYPLQKDSGTISVSNSLSNSFEIDSAEELVSVEWITKDDVANGKRSKRRQSNGSAKGTKSLSYLACVFRSGKIQILSPFQKQPVNEILVGSTIFSVSALKSSIWISTNSEAVEYELNGTKPQTIIKFPKALKQVTSIKAVELSGKPLIVAFGERTYILNAAGELLHTFTTKSDDAVLVENLLVLSKEKEIIVYDALAYKKSYVITSSKIITSLHNINDNLIAGYTSSGSVELIQLAHQSVISVTSNNNKIPLAGAFLKDNKLVISWNHLEPKFQTLELGECTNDFQIDVKHNNKQTIVTKAPEPILAGLAVNPGYNVQDGKLLLLLQENVEDPKKLLQVLISNEEESKIKTVISSLPDDIALKIYNTLSSRVQNDPSESSTLNIWLKWLLVSHSVVINSHGNIKPLKSSVKKSIKNLPDLLALQGRLELLQSQFQLRTQLTESEDVTATQDELIAKEEESIEYGNGENDDGEDVLEEAGNSQSEPESEPEDFEDDE